MEAMIMEQISCTFFVREHWLTVSLHHTDFHLVSTPALESRDLVVVTTQLLLIQYLYSDLYIPRLPLSLCR